MTNAEEPMQQQEHVDPHASKIPPDDPRLQLPKPRSRTLKKGPVIAITVVLVGAIFLAIMMAVQPPKKAVKVDEKNEAAVSNTMAIPDVITQGPDNSKPVTVPDTTITAPIPDDVPALGKPLPGDLGHAMVKPSENRYQNSAQYQQLDPAEQERHAALTSSPFFGGTANAATPVTSGGGFASAPAAPAQAGAQAGTFGRDQNNQARKNDFFATGGGDEKEYVSKPMRKAASRYEVKAGSIIPAILVTGLNSDLPGNVIAMVKENVYDTVTGDYLLVPQGTRVLGKYDSMVSYGQKRVQVGWVRMIRPDGSSIMLENMPGVDLAGMSGYKDKVDNHFDRLVGGAMLSSILSVGATISQGTYTNEEDMTTQQRMAASVGQDINSAGQQITRKNLDIQPTLKIRAGMTVNILVNKDMIVEPYKN
jgi:type IV secretion system protein VirB10